MNAKQVIGTILDTTVKLAVIAAVVTYTYRYAMQAFEFGYRISAEPPVSTAETARSISISVTGEATVMDIGEVLEEKGMIKDARLFYIQERLSVYHGKLKPGVYELSSDMTAKEMLAVMSAESVETEEGTEESGTDIEDVSLGEPAEGESQEGTEEGGEEPLGTEDGGEAQDGSSE